MMPTNPSTLDDEMADELYEHPPGLMPSAEESFDSIAHDGWLGIYQEGEQSSTILKSDTTMEIEP